MTFDFKTLKGAAFSGILFMSVYHALSAILQGSFVVSFLFLFGSVLTTIALLNLNKTKHHDSTLTLFVLLLSYCSLFICMLTQLDSAHTVSAWLCLVIICSTLLLSNVQALTVNLSTLLVFWIIVLLSSNRSLSFIEPALILSLITLLASFHARVSKNLVQQLEQSIKTDSLTGCIQADEFKLELTKAAQLFKRHHTPFSLICIKYDSSFPFENELELWLKEIAQLYQSRLRKTDILCRFNSQKFMILLSSTPYEKASLLCADLKRCAEAYEFSYQKVANPHNIKTTLNFVAQTYTENDNLDDWLQVAQSQ